MFTASVWIKDITELARQAELDYVDLIIDQAGWQLSILPALRVMKPEVRWFSLFTGTPEESLLHDAPILIRLRLEEHSHHSLLLQLMNEAAPRARLMLLISPIGFDVLATELRNLSQFEFGKDTGLLRYFDPRIFRMLLDCVLNEEQRERYLRLAFWWSWLDRDNVVAWEPGHWGAQILDGVEQEPIKFDDKGFFALGDLSDAHKRAIKLFSGSLGKSKEEVFKRCFLENASSEKLSRI